MSLVFSLLLIFGAIGRLIPHPANFAPIGALGIFAGLYARNWKQAVALPIVARLVTDLLIGFFTPAVMVSVYIATAIGTLLGIFAKKKKSWVTIAGATLTGSIIFYLFTNFAVWKFDLIYSKDFNGLLKSYSMAVPFFRNTLLGDIFYVTVLVGSYELAINLKSKILPLSRARVEGNLKYNKLKESK